MGKFPYLLGWGFRATCGGALYWDILLTGRQSAAHMSQDLHDLPNFTFIVCFYKPVLHKWVSVPSIWK